MGQGQSNSSNNATVAAPAPQQRVGGVQSGVSAAFAKFNNKTPGSTKLWVKILLGVLALFVAVMIVAVIIITRQPEYQAIDTTSSDESMGGKVTKAAAYANAKYNNDIVRGLQKMYPTVEGLSIGALVASAIAITLTVGGVLFPKQVQQGREMGGELFGKILAGKLFKNAATQTAAGEKPTVPTTKEVAKATNDTTTLAPKTVEKKSGNPKVAETVKKMEQRPLTWGETLDVFNAIGAGLFGSNPDESYDNIIENVATVDEVQQAVEST